MAGSSCQEWFDASSNLADKPYTVTLIQPIPADMPTEQMDRSWTSWRSSLKHGQNAFASTAKHVLRGLDGSKPKIENVAPMSQIVEIASKLPDPEVAATKQVQDVAPEPHARPPKPQVKETKAKVNGHVHGIHTRQVRGARTPKSVASSSVRIN
jgi:hypothetical protein